MLSAVQIVALHDQATLHWHDLEAPPPFPRTPFDQLVVDQHRANFDLWHREDEARDPAAADHTIATIKHDIDRLNQLRNDLAERIDVTLLTVVPEIKREASLTDIPLHSESPGLMIDRLSILALKLFHTDEEAHRPGATNDHHLRNIARLAVLTEQRDDLAHCLDELWADVLTARRRFKLYRQLKMYNDPSLNPVLYGKSS